MFTVSYNNNDSKTSLAPPSDLMRCAVWLKVLEVLKVSEVRLRPGADLIFGDVDYRPSGAPPHQVTPHCRNVVQSVT